MEMDIKKNQQEFEELLRSTGREGMDFVIEDLEKGGFFEAPASASHHLNTARRTLPAQPQCMQGRTDDLGRPEES